MSASDNFEKPTSAHGNMSDVLNQNVTINAVANDNIGTAIPISNQEIVSACGKTSDTTNQTEQIPTYSQKISAGPKYLSNPKETFPKKDQAIIIPSMPEITTEEYIKEVSKYTNPKNIIYAQKITNNRMCLFLKSKEKVEELLTETSQIVIRDHTLPIRKLINPATRVIITGGSPIIPHLQIEKALIGKDIQLVTGVTFLRTAIQDPEFQHIQSFNRQFFANIPDGCTIPETLTIDFEQETYRLFLNLSGTCYKCKKTGHIVKDCPLNIRTRTPHLNEEIMETDADDSETQSETVAPPINKTVERLAVKRAQHASTSSQSEIENTYPTATASTTNTLKALDPSKKYKKVKTIPVAPVPIENHLTPVEHIIASNPTEYAVTYEELRNYIIQSKGCKNIRALTAKYTQNNNLMIDTLTKLYPEITNKNLKGRFTKLVNILQNCEERDVISSSDGD